MQFLKDEIENKIIPSSKENGELSEYQYSHNVAYQTVLTIIKYALEKEKEQIIDAANQKIFGDITFTDNDEVITKGENYYNQTYKQESIDAGAFIADLLTKELEELGDEDLETREEVQNLAVDPVLRLKEDYDPNTINFRWNDTEEVILKISKEGFYYRGELVEDIHNVYERFNEWLTKIE